MATPENDIMYIDVKEFTDNVTTDTGTYEVSGTGIFDVLMMTATKHLAAQYTSGRIRGEDYATMYARLYEVTLQAAMQTWLQKGIAEKQLDLLAKQVETEDAKKNLHKRQIEGLDEDYKQKILKICMDSWSVGFSVAKDSFEASGIPAPMTKVAIDDLFNSFIIPELDSYEYARPDLETP